MNFKKAGIFRRSSEGSEQPEVQNDSGGMLAVWGSPGSGKTVTAVKIAKMLSAKKKNVILLLCDMTAPMLPCICSPDELECERSLGNILAAARIGENLIKHMFYGSLSPSKWFPWFSLLALHLFENNQVLIRQVNNHRYIMWIVNSWTSNDTM